MKKIRLYAIIVATALVAGVTIFYACTKDKNNIADNLKKETGFVARINKNMCVQVDVFRDEDNNVCIVTKDVANETKLKKNLVMAQDVKLKPAQSKDDGGIVFEIPNDAIYWLVPLDGSEPIKFEPVKDTKATSSISGSLEVKCKCIYIKGGCTGSIKCKRPYWREIPGANPAVVCDPEGECCDDCDVEIVGPPLTTTTTITQAFTATSCFLVQSPVVTVNSVLYR